MANRRAMAVLLALLFAHSVPTAAFSKLQASASTDGLYRQAATAAPVVPFGSSPIYVIGGGYSTASGGSAETSCGSVLLEDITTLAECQSAAEQVGIATINMVGPGTWHHVPYGCSVLQGAATPESGTAGATGKVHFSTTSGHNNGGTGGYVLICRKQATTTDRIAVFSAQFGGRDHLEYKYEKDTKDDDLEDTSFNRWTEEESYQNSETFSDGVFPFLFTDMVNVHRNNNSAWQFVYPAQQPEELCDDNVLCEWKKIPNLTRSQKKVSAVLRSKFFKIRWIAESTHYDYILWMDGKYLMRNDNLAETIHQYMGKDVDMLAMSHPRGSVAAELGPASERAAHLLGNKSVIQQAHEIYKRYKREGFTDTVGLFESAMFVVRPARVHDMFIDWWHEVQQGVPRDQISLPWMAQKHGIKVRRIRNDACIVLGKNCRNPRAHSR